PARRRAGPAAGRARGASAPPSGSLLVPRPARPAGGPCSAEGGLSHIATPPSPTYTAPMMPADRRMPAPGEPADQPARPAIVPVRDRAVVMTSIVLMLIAAVAWIDVIRSSLGAPDMMMTLFMPATIGDALAFVA